MDGVAIDFQNVEQDVGTRQSGVPAQFYLGCRRKPADVIAITLFNEEHGFGEVVLDGNGLHQISIQP